MRRTQVVQLHISRIREKDRTWPLTLRLIWADWSLGFLSSSWLVTPDIFNSFTARRFPVDEKENTTVAQMTPPPPIPTQPTHNFKVKDKHHLCIPRALTGYKGLFKKYPRDGKVPTWCPYYLMLRSYHNLKILWILIL